MEPAVAVPKDHPGADQGWSYDDETLFDLHTILGLLRSLSQDRLLKKARELGIVITPKDLHRGGQAAILRIVRHIHKPRVWAELRDWTTWCYSGEIALIKAARGSRVIDELLNRGFDWSGVYWLCLKAGKYHAGIVRRYGQPAVTALDEVRERSRSLLAAADGIRGACAEGQAHSLRSLQTDNLRLSKDLAAAEVRIAQLKRDLLEARQSARVAKRTAWEATRQRQRLQEEAKAEKERLQAQAEAAEASTRRGAEEAESFLEAMIAEYERQLAVLRGVIEQQDAEILEQLAAARRNAACAGAPGVKATVSLHGRTICVVGGDTRMPGYRAIIEAHGGEMVFASALEKVGQIEGAVSGADGVVLIAAYASHKASGQVRSACERFGKPLALAHNAGLATFERVLVAELAPKLAGS